MDIHSSAMTFGFPEMDMGPGFLTVGTKPIGKNFRRPLGFMEKLTCMLETMGKSTSNRRD